MFRQSPLFRFARAGDVYSLSQLILDGVDVNAKNDEGATALMLAAQNSHIECIRYLIQCGLNAHTTDRNGATALMYAAQGGCARCIQFFLSKGVNIEARDRNGLTALMIAAKNGHCDGLRHMACRADVDAKDHDGKTALSWAAEKGHVECVDFLLERHAEVNTRTNEGMTPLMLASRNDHTECMNSLITMGAHIDVEHDLGTPGLDFPDPHGYYDMIGLVVPQGPLPFSTSENSDLSSPSPADESSLCRICYEGLGTAAFLHCDASGRTTSHGGYCEECVKAVQRNQGFCPTCRQRITGIIHQHFT